LLSREAPAAVRLYLTVARVDDVTVTDVTLAEIWEASGLLARALSAPENAEPFCSSATRSLVGVDGLKNFSQLAVISAAAPVLVPVALADAGAVGEDVVPVGLAGVDEGVELVEHPVAVSTATIAPATAMCLIGAGKLRPAMCWNRIARLRGLGRICLNAVAFLPALCATCGYFHHVATS